MDWAAAEIFSTLDRVVMASAHRSSQFFPFSGSIASDFTVCIPCTVSTSNPCRPLSAW